MIFLIIYLVCLFVVIGAGALAALSDLRGLTIPNFYSALIGGMFFICFGLMWLGGHGFVFGPLLSHLLAALIVFAVTLGMFALKGLGAADSKLGTVYALWAGLSGLVAFLFYMAVIGGVLALAGLAIRKWKPFKEPAKDGWIDRIQKGESKVPYGIAIVGGALASFVKIGYVDYSMLSAFLQP